MPQNGKAHVDSIITITDTDGIQKAGFTFDQAINFNIAVSNIIDCTCGPCPVTTTPNPYVVHSKIVVTKERMQKLEKPEEWTQIVMKKAKFNIPIPGSTFTLSNLRNPRE